MGLLRGRSEHFALVVASHFAQQMNALAYELLDGWRSSQATYGGERAYHNVFPNRVFEPGRWIALGRYAETASDTQLTERDRDEIAKLTVDECLNTQFTLLHGILTDGKRCPTSVVDAAREGLHAEDWIPRFHAIQLAVRFEETRDEGLTALLRWVEESLKTLKPELLPETLSSLGHGMFCGHGWGREHQRARLHPLMGELLRRGIWSLDLWRSLLSPWLYQSGPRLSRDQVVERIRDIVAEHLIQVARCSDESIERRRRAVDAIALLGASTYARDLGTLLREDALKEDVRRAQGRLRDRSRVSPLPPDVALDLGVRAFLRVIP